MAVALDHRAEMLRALAEVFGDFTTFAELCDIRTKSGGLQRFLYDGWHEEQVRFNRERTGRDLVLKPRQIGFSTLELVRDLHVAVARTGVNVLIVAHDRDLADQLFGGVRIAADALRRRGLLPKTRHDNVRELVFGDRGSSIRVVEAGETERSAEKKGRSGTIHRLHATELAFWGQPQDTMTSLLACVPDGDDGEVVIESTPNGSGGLFYDLVQSAIRGDGPYRLHFFPWYQHRAYRTVIPPTFDPSPRNRWEGRLRAEGCTDQQIAWWRTKVDNPAIGLDKALQEWPIDPASCFRSSGKVYVPPDTVDELEAKTRKPLRRETLTGVHKGEDGRPATWSVDALIFESPDPADSYVVGSDISEGVEADASAADVMSRKTGRTVATMWSDTLDEGDWGRALVALGKLYGNAELAPERNGPGQAVLRAIERELYPWVYRAEDDKPGWNTTPVSRPPMFDELRTACVGGLVSHPDANTVAETKTLIRDPRGKPAAKGKGTKGGCKDDRFIAWAIAWQVRQRPRIVIGYRPRHLPGF